MLELHYSTVTKTILERQYPAKPTLKVAFGNGNGAIFENSSKLRASLFVTSRWPRSSGQTNYQVHHPPWSGDTGQQKHYFDSCQLIKTWMYNIRLQVPKLARKCEIKHGYACGVDGRKVGWSVYGHVIAEFSRMDRFSKLWGFELSP